MTDTHINIDQDRNQNQEPGHKGGETAIQGLQPVTHEGNGDDAALAVTSGAFMPYPVSTMSPAIVPNDLTNFKSRGVSNIQKDTAQRLNQLKDQYYKVVDDFNWNKLIYESQFGFEPVIGQTYYLYRSSVADEEFSLSMIEPERWKKPFIGAFSLGADGRWIVEKVHPDFSLKDYLEARKADRG